MDMVSHQSCIMTSINNEKILSRCNQVNSGSGSILKVKIPQPFESFLWWFVGQMYRNLTCQKPVL